MLSIIYCYFEIYLENCCIIYRKLPFKATIATFRHTRFVSMNRNFNYQIGWIKILWVINNFFDHFFVYQNILFPLSVFLFFVIYFWIIWQFILFVYYLVRLDYLTACQIFWDIYPKIWKWYTALVLQTLYTLYLFSLMNLAHILIPNTENVCPYWDSNLGLFRPESSLLPIKTSQMSSLILSILNSVL